MFRNMVTSLFKHDRIRTTDAKAKELRRWADRIITLAKKGDLHARRQALSIVREKDVVHKLFEQAQERFGKINGGYTRIIKLGRRPGDAAAVSLIELISIDAMDKKTKRKSKSTPKRQAKPAVEKAPAEKSKAKADDAAAETSEEKTKAAPVAPKQDAETDADDPGENKDAASGSDSAVAAPQAEAKAAEEPVSDEQKADKKQQ
jgi:large subunit ribosomal protein L17